MYFTSVINIVVVFTFAALVVGCTPSSGTSAGSAETVGPPRPVGPLAPNPNPLPTSAPPAAVQGLPWPLNNPPQPAPGATGVSVAPMGSVSPPSVGLQVSAPFPGTVPAPAPSPTGGGGAGFGGAGLGAAGMGDSSSSGDDSGDSGGGGKRCEPCVPKMEE